jgi:hypothetical protein
MKTISSIRSAALVLSLALMPWLSVLSTQAAVQSLQERTRPPEISKGIGDAKSPIQSDAPARIAPAQATWVDGIMEALRMYFKTNYPASDFAAYLKQLTTVRDAMGRGDRRTVNVEMGTFFTMLAIAPTALANALRRNWPISRRT